LPSGLIEIASAGAALSRDGAGGGAAREATFGAFGTGRALGGAIGFGIAFDTALGAVFGLFRTGRRAGGATGASFLTDDFGLMADGGRNGRGALTAPRAVRRDGMGAGAESVGGRGTARRALLVGPPTFAAGGTETGRTATDLGGARRLGGGLTEDRGGGGRFLPADFLWKPPFGSVSFDFGMRRGGGRSNPPGPRSVIAPVSLE